jgi:mevalonate kinase
MLVKNFYSNGKLLLTGEYLVLDGAISLAMPTKYGQDLTVEMIKLPYLIWESFDEIGNQWFLSKIELPTLKPDANNKIASTLLNILKVAQNLNPEFLSDGFGFHVKTKLSFPTNWGLGTSSTLINNIAQWANIDAYDLLKNSFGGSGYDIACAQNNSPVIYQLIDERPSIKVVKFNPTFKDQLYFVYLKKSKTAKRGLENTENSKAILWLWHTRYLN